MHRSSKRVIKVLGREMFVEGVKMGENGNCVRFTASSVRTSPAVTLTLKGHLLKRPAGLGIVHGCPLVERLMSVTIWRTTISFLHRPCLLATPAETQSTRATE
jgi:hypothetical protein